MLSSLITSQTRIKLLRKFFLNSNTQAHLRGLEAEFGDSTNSIRIELNRFEKAGLLTSSASGNKKLYKANDSHPLFADIHNIILKETGIDQIIESVIQRIGDLVGVYLAGEFARGIDSSIIDIILIGDKIDNEYLKKKIIQSENIIGREVRYTIFKPQEADQKLSLYKPEELLPLWEVNTSSGG